MMQAAIEYARTGWAVFPLRPGEKQPLTAHGLDDATTNLDTIRRWWTKTPTANIGLNCGKSGLVVVDADKRTDHDGLAEWAELRTKYHLTEKTSTSITGGGGRHMLYRAPKGVTIRNSAGKLAPGVDIRAEGGYIVLPPSIHPSGTPYAWSDDTNIITPLPDPVVQILTHEPDPWEIFTLRDAFAKREPLEWIVDEMISAGSLTIWYGPPGTLKSMLLTDMAMCVATGRRWLEDPGQANSGYTTSANAVMWLDFDNGVRRTHERIAALARERGLNDAAPIYYASMPRPKLAAGDPQSISDLLGRLVDRNVGLLIVDNLGKVSGDADENSADMQAPMDGLRYITEAGIAVVMIHHQRKANGVTARAGETLRGHGSIESAIDLAMQVSREENTITITPTKTRGPLVKEFSACFEYTSDSNHELVTARFNPTVTKEEKVNQELEDNIIEEVTRRQPVSANQVYDQLGGNRAQVLDAIRALVRAGKIGQRQGTRGYLLYIPTGQREF